MLTRLKVSGFKNLVDVDVRFGPFTCIAGANGVGKSNLFDAIHFLSALADKPLIDAALSVRDEGGRTSDIRSIFHRVGQEYDRQMTFEAEMIVPAEGRDDLGQNAKASITFLRYSLTIGYKNGANHHTMGSLELLQEVLVHIRLGDAHQHLLFPHKVKDWRSEVVKGKRSGGPFISTNDEGSHRLINLHQDGGGGGRPLSRAARDLPRTVLSATNAAESPTALLARREMQSWRLLQLEPSALREPDSFASPTEMGADGSHLAATLYRLAHNPVATSDSNGKDSKPSVTYATVANRLSQLIADVRDITVDRDEKRELLTVNVTDQYGTVHAARALSDGTLRFLALTVVEADPGMHGVLCLEEPENGIHPERIPAILSLLQDIATDPESPYDSQEPLRQVIINTHSPAVVTQVPDDCLLVVESNEIIRNGERSQRAVFSALPRTWRTDKDRDKSTRIAFRGSLLAYLNPVARNLPDDDECGINSGKRRRVIDREDIQPFLFPIG